MSIARFAVGSKATFAKSISRVVSTQKQPYHAMMANNPSSGVNNPQNRPFGSTTHRPQKQQREVPKAEVARRAYGSDIQAFRELLTLTNQQSKRGNRPVDIQAAMKIYNKLRDVQPFTMGDIAALIQGIHATSRTSSRRLANVISTQRIKKQEAESQELLAYIDLIAEDIRTDTAETNMFGLMQLFTCFLTMKTPARGYQLWKDFVEGEKTGQHAYRQAKSPKVVGAVIDLMLADNVPLEEIERVYNWCKEDTATAVNLEQSLCRAYIFHDEVPSALKLFNVLVKEFPKDDYYLARVHETFVGDCDNLEVARAFYDELVQKKTPYVAQCHPSAVHRLMERSWVANRNIDDLFAIWKDYLGYVSPATPERTFNILTYNLLARFFEANPEMTTDAFAYLKKIISTYSELRPQMSALFLNTLLTRVSQWQTSEVTLGIIDTYDLYNIAKKEDSYRVILNSLETVEVNEEFISNLWKDRLVLDTPIDVFDWGALARACCKPERHDLFERLYRDYNGMVMGQSNDEVRNLCSFLSRTHADTSYARAIVESVHY